MSEPGDGRPIMVTFTAGRHCLRVAVQDADWEEFMADPVIASVLRKGMAEYLREVPRDLDFVKGWIEENAVEYMTPQRVALMEEVGYDLADPMESSRAIRAAGRERGVSFGHGNALLEILNRKAAEAASASTEGSDDAR